MVTQIGKGRRVHLYIKEWMDAREVSDEKMAGRIGVARETVFRWRTEQKRLTPEKIAMLAEAMDLQPSALWSPPSSPSVDALLQGASADVRAMAYDVVQRMLKRAS